MYGDNVPGLTQEAAPRPLTTFGFYAALGTSALTLITFGIAVLTPPLAGPGCVSGCFQYPYTDIAARFPRDYWWMFPAMLQELAFAAMVVAVHHLAPRERRVFSHVAVGLAMIAFATLFTNYFVQVSVIQPSLLAGEHDGISLLTQFNPHGLFIALEEVGYVLIATSLLFLAPVFTGTTKTERALRWLFVAAFALMIVAFVVIAAQHGLRREYRFEIAIITIDFLVLIPAGFLIARTFRRATVRTA